MRRREPDALTARELEVLDLLKLGYSNRDIADDLQISLAGAKYHVSAIIAKLGVTSRQEAAEISTKSRGWAFAPMSLGGVRFHLPPFLGAKLALLTAATLVVGVVGIGGLLLVGPGFGGSSGPDDGTGATFGPCPGGPCTSFTQVEYATLEEAAADASFRPMMPAFIPEGFEQNQVRAKERDFTNPYVPEVHNDWITVTYRDGAANRLVISQGFPAMINARFALPGSEKRVLEVNGRQALWSDRAIIAFPNFNMDTDLEGVLTVYVGRFRSGWGDEGSWFSGSPMEYSIGSDSLSLEELISIAESVTFPAMLEPIEGFSPEPYFD